MRRLLLCTDLDRTLIPNGTHIESPSAKHLFQRLVERDDIHLAYVTGRHRESIERAIRDYDLPIPDYAIGDVGTTIYRVDDKSWKNWPDWQQQLSQNWSQTAMEQLKFFISTIKEFTYQEEEKQNQFKASFYLPLDADIDRLNRCLECEMVRLEMQANLIWSTSEVEGVRLLDILPASANKLHAIRHLMQREQFNWHDTVFAGDSGNDKEVLCSEIQSILVGNAEFEMKQWALINGDETLYIAKGGNWGLNGAYRSGILEGVCHFWPDIRNWMQKMHSQEPN